MDFTKVRVLIPEGTGRQVLTILHGLKDIGCNVTVLCSSKLDTCYASKLPDKKHLEEDADSSKEGFLDLVLRYVKTEEYDVLFPIGEAATNKITCIEGELRKYVKLACAPRKAYIQAFDKQNTFEKAMEIGIPCPYTRKKNQSIEDYLSKAHFPLIIKPRKSVGSIGFHKFKTVEEFNEWIEKGFFDPNEYIIQEFVDHEARIGNYLFTDKDSELRFASAQRILRWYPIDAGTACLVETIDSPDTIKSSYRLLKALGWQGFAAPSYMIEKSTGLPFLLEINGRIPASVKLTWLCGYNIARQMIEFAYGVPVIDYSMNNKFGYLARHIQADFLWFLKSPDRFRAKPSWFSWKKTGDLVFFKDDPRPAITYTLQMILSYKKNMKKRKH